MLIEKKIESIIMDSSLNRIQVEESITLLQKLKEQLLK